MPELSVYSSVLFVHAVSALILFASGIFAPLTLRMIRGARTLAELKTWVAFEQQSTKWNPLAALALLGTGIYLGSFGWWTQPWFFVSVAAWIVSCALAVAIVGRTTGTLDAAKGPGEAPVPAALDALRWSKAWTAANGALLANDLAMLYVMFNKPDLIGSIALVVVANAVAVAVFLMRHQAAVSTSTTVTATEAVS